MRVLRLIGGLVFLGLIVLLAFIVFAWESEIDPIEPLAVSAPGMTFKEDLVLRGERLALVGNCISCHTAPGGGPFAGGLPIQTPFGTIHSTNITPDADTGIGRWSREAFIRSMREGVDRRGRHLYPAFPYDHFRLMTDEDIDAVYAYLMTRPPLRAEARQNDLPFPFNIRLLVAGWKGLFLEQGVYQATPERSAEWNRGAYLVQGAGHCAACHTPRNLLGAEKEKQHLAGGETGGWYAPAINAESPAPAPWTADRLYAYLRFGMDDVHAVPAGPMQPVVLNLARVPDEDIRAIAVYVASLNARPDVELEKATAQAVERAKEKSRAMASASAAPPAVSASAGGSATPKGPAKQNGAAIYAAACASCHALGRGTPGGALYLSLGTSVHLPAPNNLIHIIRQGIVPPEGESGPWMPAFAGALDQAQTVALVDYLRAYFGEKPEWRDVDEHVKQLNQEQP